MGLLQALDHLFRSFIDIWTAEITHARRNTLLTQSGPPAATGGDLEDLDYTDEDWANFQVALHLLASARAVYEHMDNFEAKLKTSLGHVAVKMIGTAGLSTRRDFSLLAQSALNSAELHRLLINIESDSSSQTQDVTQTPSASRRSHLNPLAGSPSLLVEGRNAIVNFSRACQVTLQTTLLSPLRKHLATYASSPQWTTPGAPKSTRIVNDLQAPSFSLSPSDTAARRGRVAQPTTVV